MINMNLSVLEEPIQVNGPLYVVIKNQAYYAEVIKELYNFETCTKIKLFDSTYESLKGQELLIITDILGFDINAPSMVKLIYADLEPRMNLDVEVKTQIEYFTNKLTNIVANEVVDFDLKLTMNEITIQELFKALGIKIEVNDASIFQKRLNIIDVYKYLSKKKCLILINISSYLAVAEMSTIHEYMRLHQLNILFLE